VIRRDVKLLPKSFEPKPAFMSLKRFVGKKSRVQSPAGKPRKDLERTPILTAEKFMNVFEDSHLIGSQGASSGTNEGIERVDVLHRFVPNLKHTRSNISLQIAWISIHQ